MKKGFIVSVLAFLTVISSAALAAAAEAANPGASVDYTRTIVVVVSLLVAGGAMAVGTLGTSHAMGQGLSSAANSVGRNPEAHGKILITMMVGLAMIESLAIYCLVVALIVLYANPLLKVIGV